MTAGSVPAITRLALADRAGRRTRIEIDGEPWAAFLNALGAYKYFNMGR